MANWVSIVICDVNYALDPLVRISLFNENAASRVFLIDEIHNLPDRGRKMYSAKISSFQSNAIKKQLPRTRKKSRIFLGELTRFLDDCAAHIDAQAPQQVGDIVVELLGVLIRESAAEESGNLFEEANNEYVQWLKEIYRFSVIFALSSDAHCCIFSKRKVGNKEDTIVELFCKDASKHLQQRLKSARASVGFAILGSIFGEGVDFAGDALIGAIIIGTGMPQPNQENKVISEHCTVIGLNGFQRVYQFPGFTRVQQTAGGVIRSEHDVGVVILIDPRFATRDYLAIIPPHWGMQSCSTQQGLERLLATFWLAHPAPATSLKH